MSQFPTTPIVLFEFSSFGYIVYRQTLTDYYTITAPDEVLIDFRRSLKMIFLQCPIKDYRDIDTLNKQLSNWFDENVVNKKREDLSALITKLVQEYHPDKLPLPKINLQKSNVKKSAQDDIIDVDDEDEESDEDIIEEDEDEENEDEEEEADEEDETDDDETADEEKDEAMELDQQEEVGSTIICFL